MIMKEVENDDELQEIIRILKDDPKGKSNYQWVDGRLLYKGRLVMLKFFLSFQLLLHTFYDSVLRAHSRFIRTYKRMNIEIHWMDMKNDVKI